MRACCMQGAPPTAPTICFYLIMNNSNQQNSTLFAKTSFSRIYLIHVVTAVNPKRGNPEHQNHKLMVFQPQYLSKYKEGYNRNKELKIDGKNCKNRFQFFKSACQQNFWSLFYQHHWVHIPYVFFI